MKLKGLLSRIKRFLRKSGGYSLLEMLVTLAILTIIFSLTAVLVTTTVRTSLKTELRSSIRQEVETNIEVMRRYIRSASFSTDNGQQVLGCQAANNLASGFVVPLEGNHFVSFYFDAATGKLMISKDGGSRYDVTSSDVKITLASISCVSLQSGNYTYIITVNAESNLTNTSGAPLVSNIAKQTSVTTRSKQDI